MELHRAYRRFSRPRSHLDGSLVIGFTSERILAIADEIVVIADGVVQQAGPRLGAARYWTVPAARNVPTRRSWKTMNGITEKLLTMFRPLALSTARSTFVKTANAWGGSPPRILK